MRVTQCDCRLPVFLDLDISQELLVMPSFACPISISSLVPVTKCVLVTECLMAGSMLLECSD